ncbi:MAG: lipid-A-disaccharide synthase N-terminal domain-containing protein [bacterium]
MIGYVGLVALALCWIPQSIDTIKRGECLVNLPFLLLSSIGSFCLALYAFSIQDTVFTILNSLTTVGAVVNICYKFFPRKSAA